MADNQFTTGEQLAIALRKAVQDEIDEQALDDDEKNHCNYADRSWQRVALLLDETLMPCKLIPPE